MKSQISYLLVTLIPFTRDADGDPVVDGLWASDLEALASSMGQIRVAAPEIPRTKQFQTWGPGSTTLTASSGVTFVGFPMIESRLDLWKWPKIRAILRKEVEQADLVHSSNPFSPYLGIRYAHDLAVQLGKKTLMVVAEDFVDMLEWEWVRTSKNAREKRQRSKELKHLEMTVREMVATASLSFLHTPAAVQRFRLHARNAVAIRQALHEEENVITTLKLEERLMEMSAGRPLRIAAACRHSDLKGLNMLIQAIGLLKDRGIRVEASLYGRGAETGMMKTLVASRNLEDQVQIPGTLSPGPELYNTLSQFDLFSMVHRTTDFGRAFWDGMACGLPVIAFRTKASQDTVRDGLDGFITPLDDPQSLAEKIAHLHRHRELIEHASREARERALNNTMSIWFEMRAQWIRDLFLKEGLSAGDIRTTPEKITLPEEARVPAETPVFAR